MEAAVVEIELLRALAARLATARYGEQGQIMAEACQALNASKGKIYTRLKQLGLYDSGRKQRSDAGKTCISEEDALRAAGMIHLGTRANGKRTLSIKASNSVLSANGMGRVDEETGEILSVSPTTLARAMRKFNCHPEQLESGHPALSMRSLHPNHVWQIDMSVATLFYAPEGGINGIQHLDDTEVYKNKPDAIARVQKDLCTRWLITDHTSDCYFVRYMAGHEDALSCIEFFLEAIQARPNGEPFHGVPVILVMDPGAAARAAIARNLFDRLGIKVIVHRTKNARAKGGVEGGHNRWELTFESRLALWKPENLQALNAKADEVRRAHCASAVHTRHRMTRYGAWLNIREDQLRLAPPIELCRELVTTGVQERTVNNQLQISYAVSNYGSHTYLLRNIPGVAVGDKVRVVVNPYRAPAIDILMRQADGSDQSYTVVPAEHDEFGFMADGNVWGEPIRALPESAAERQLKRINKMAYDVPTQAEADAARKARAVAFDGEINPFADFEQAVVPQYIPRRGSEHAVTAQARELPPVPLVEAVRQRKANGDTRPNLYALLQGEFGEFVPASVQFEAIEELRAAGSVRAAGGQK
jgi:hypothetical protein